MKNNYFFLVIVLFFLCSSCWNLDKEEIISFNNQFGEDGSGYNVKSDIIQLEDFSYLAVGTDIDSQIALFFYSEDGSFVRKENNLGKGVAHSIVTSFDETNEKWILVTEDRRSKIVRINSNNSLIDSLDLFKKVDEQLGLLDSLMLFDMIGKRDSSLILTGYLKQAIGDKRLIVLKLNWTGEMIWLRSYGDNAVGTAIRNWGDNYALSGFKNGKGFIASISKDGVLNWEKVFSDTQEDFFNSIITEGDSLIHFIGTSDITNGNKIVYKVITTGQITSVEKYFGTDGDITQGYYIMQDRNENLVLLGTKNRMNSDPQILLFSINRSGEENWSTSYESEEGVIPSKIIQAKDFGFSIFGITGDTTSTNYQFIKTDEEGILRN